MQQFLVVLRERIVEAIPSPEPSALERRWARLSPRERHKIQEYAVITITVATFLIMRYYLG